MPLHVVVELPQTGKVKRTLENIQIVVIDFQVLDKQGPEFDRHAVVDRHLDH